ncbi:uncharacterized protein BP01DRAFT_75902 [Aspergillus saccharolyticus JOP 1030-1]|uniref:Uncharacterized protein n=1 Tax=Aspergillus saccharolyticus JOP 1030-1 TaxID=1450539 RepID=A0A318ZRX0_9EURO|nr:hypothetical protein BP01DRAFT_75902 [Aspergillus saccharolyticus JOP 1030-1]PYH49354.1 hypothetical protein BP01DRAFT_75902 [Aspergillus saccharolyticus JOP 1030-1]
MKLGFVFKVKRRLSYGMQPFTATSCPAIANPALHTPCPQPPGVRCMICWLNIVFLYTEMVPDCAHVFPFLTVSVSKQAITPGLAWPTIHPSPMALFARAQSGQCRAHHAFTTKTSRISIVCYSIYFVVFLGLFFFTATRFAVSDSKRQFTVQWLLLAIAVTFMLLYTRRGWWGR